MLVEELRKRYLEAGDIERFLQGSGIEILKDFLENWEAVLAFNRKYYSIGEPKVMLCGINPGRFGAGKTGVPLIDFKSLSKLIPNIVREDSERSAQFFYEVIDHFGAQNFYRSFYVGNVSWLGYTKDKRNLNFDRLPRPGKEAVISLFRYEMSYIKPAVVISMGDVVKETVEQVLGSSTRTDLTLPHPYYCSFPTRKEKCKRYYIEALEPFVKTS